MRAGGPQREGLAGTPGPPEAPHVTGTVVQQCSRVGGPGSLQPPSCGFWALLYLS